jgi:hypothetical protein
MLSMLLMQPDTLDAAGADAPDAADAAAGAT